MIIRRGGTLCLQKTLQQAPRCFGVTPRLQDLIKDIAVLIDRPPKPVLFPSDADDDLVEMPDVVAARPLTTEPACVVPPELQSPAPHRLIGDDDTALQQHLLHQAEAQGKPNIWRGGNRWRL